MFESAPFDDEKNQECARLVRVCAEIFNGPNLSEQGMAVYLKAICCTDADKVIEALKRWLPNEQRFPFPADIRLSIRHIAEDKKRREEMDAWEKAREREAEAKKRYEEFIAREPAETELTAAETGQD